ncbi:DUF4136 domain-containing protein [Pelagicoccus mobilis]|uniref:DUF4136 domain-containing protein n=1 Tax=Pelagicoccus mobilis TaxID=415221 RepID=A0A934RW64_9BACT|nr:DUF4136 domain-containing protein [Pelagicoccus mobilis]MBK1877601.1 DUF4136 domain-containing protein [Pelagicoccus mobilis]
MKKRVVSLITLLIAVLALPGCKTTSLVRVESDNSITNQIASLSTFGWVEGSTVQGKDRIHKIPQLDENIRAAVNAFLEIKGYVLTAPQKADMHLIYHVSLTDASESTSMGTAVSRDFEWNQEPSEARDLVIEYERGSLLLDVMNPETGKVMWRGLVSQIVDPERPQRTRRAKAFKNIEKLLEEFPKKKR